VIRFNIKYRIFMAMLAATAAVVLCMFLIVQWSLTRGFLQYVNTLEQERLDNLAGELVQEYAGQGSWDFLRDEPVSWLRLMIRTLPPGALSPEQLQRLKQRLEQPATGRSYRFELRVVLLGADRKPVFGPATEVADSNLRTLTSDGRAIGYLGLAPRPSKNSYDVHQLRFVRQQTLALALIAGVTLLVSALLALPLAKRLVRPIRALATATHQLTVGEYTTRVPIVGTDELGHLARDFNTLALTLEKNEQARRQWVADISHELRTPLAVLRGEIEALQDGVRQATPEAISSLHVEALHLGRLVDDLYQLALSDLGALSYRKQNLELKACLEAALESYRAQFADKPLTLHYLGPQEELRLFADPARLHQLFANLLENTLRYTDSDGRLEIVLARAAGNAVIDFRDSAPGVPESEMDHLFERLYRVETSRSRASGGAGLGLAICRNIVEAHGGTIVAHPSPLGGIWLRIELPLEKSTV